MTDNSVPQVAFREAPPIPDDFDADLTSGAEEDAPDELVNETGVDQTPVPDLGDEVSA